jgi:hypothetical protein
VARRERREKEKVYEPLPDADRAPTVVAHVAHVAKDAPEEPASPAPEPPKSSLAERLLEQKRKR